MFSDILFIIPARGGSKGLPGKNIKPFLGKPLIHHSIEYARRFAHDEHICLTTDDEGIIACASEIGLKVPFIRPAHLATDTADSFGVLKHAYAHYQTLNRQYRAVVLLQPTSPIRLERHLTESLALLIDPVEMVVSVCEAKSNPYYNLFEEDEGGFLKISKGDASYTRRQDLPKVYEYNGSIYVFNATVLENKHSFQAIANKVKYVMDDAFSIDIDTLQDWQLAENRFADWI